MRLGLLLLLGCVVSPGQSAGLKEFLALTPMQVGQVVQLNAALDQAVNAKQRRFYALNGELDAEYAKASPDPVALGQRYQERNSITQDVAALRAGAQASVTALLTDAQKAKVAQISSATVQQSLVADASCAYLAPAPPTPPFFIGRSGNFLLDPSGSFSLYYPVASANSGIFTSLLPYPAISAVFSNCSPGFPISIRNLFSLTDSQVAAIEGLITANNSLVQRKQARVSDVQVEIRDETAKSALDALALGVRYVELNEISQELQGNDQRTRAAARELLNSSQMATLQSLLDASALSQYALPAESCHFFSPPPGVVNGYFSEASCANYF